MALSRIGSSADLANLFARSSYAGNHEAESLSQYVTTRSYSTSASSTSQPQPQPPPEKESNSEKKPSMQMSKREKLQLVIRDYGRTVIVFHIGISLMSLGMFYTLVSSGLDMTPWIKIFTPTATEADPTADALVSKIMGEGSTFLVAYAIHKLFAPVRISLTLGLTPIIVRYLRSKGILKPPKNMINKAKASASSTPPTR